VEAQRKIEEAIRQQAVMENMEHAIEYSPESFGRVLMLYINVEVNSHPIKAFVDSGAQQTIMNPETAEACGLMRLLDTRFSGIARGVGTAKIIGRVHSAQMKLADLFLPCSFTVMEGRDVDLLLGLDMLKAHQACIDLEKGVLRIQGREVRFLSEHELPDNARDPREPPQAAISSGGPSVSTPSTSSLPAPAAFPGGGRTIGSAPAGTSAPTTSSPPRPLQRAPPSEQSIQILMDFGATREMAIRTLEATGGNVDMAASLLF
jgi:DNA damage-inducible protein 1